MGWGMANGIGWPNQGKRSNNYYDLTITNCEGSIAYVYSDSPFFTEGVYLYENLELTIPFNGENKAWNTWTGFEITSGNSVDSNGFVNYLQSYC